MKFVELVRRHLCSVMLGALAVACASCGSDSSTLSSTDPTADDSDRCKVATESSLEVGDIGSLLSSETFTVATLRRWRSDRGGVSDVSSTDDPLAGHSDDAEVQICVYAATDLVTPRPPGATEPDAVRLLVLPGGDVVFDSAGPREVLLDDGELRAAETAGPLPPPSTKPGDPYVEIASGNDSRGSWSVSAQVDGDVVCYAVFYRARSDPEHAECFDTEALNDIAPVLGIEIRSPHLLLAVAGPDVDSAIVTFDNDKREEVVLRQAPSGLGSYRYAVVELEQGRSAIGLTSA